MSNNFSSALERAKAIAAKLTAGAGAGAGAGAADAGGAASTSGGQRNNNIPYSQQQQMHDLNQQQLVKTMSGGYGRRGEVPLGDMTLSRSIQITVPSHMVPLLLGRGGETLKNIELSCNVNIQFSEKTGDGNAPRVATVTGEPMSIQAAKVKIDDIVHGSGALSVLIGGQHRPGDKTIYVQVAANRVGLVIGRGGETIKSLQDRTGARINVVKEEERGPTRTVVVSGSQMQLAQAQKEIDDIVNGTGYAAAFGVGAVTEQIRVAKDKIGLIIGKGGETIKQIQGECKVKLNIEQNTEIDGDRVVTIAGSPEAIAMAKEMIEDKVGVKRTLTEGQLGAQFDANHARQDPAYAAAYGNGARPGGVIDIKQYVDYYRQYYESMGYTFPPGFDFEGYLTSEMKM